MYLLQKHLLQIRRKYSKQCPPGNHSLTREYNGCQQRSQVVVIWAVYTAAKILNMFSQGVALTFSLQDMHVHSPAYSLN